MDAPVSLEHKIAAANREAHRRILAADPVLTDVRTAGEALALGEHTILHAGPPITWERMCGPMRGAVAGAILDPGDEVLLLAPYWPLIEGIVRSFHGRPVAVPMLDELGAPGSGGDPAAAIAAVESRLTGRSVALYISTPNNPSGRVLPPAWVEGFAELARRHDLWLISDETYEKYLFAGEHRRALPLATSGASILSSTVRADGCVIVPRGLEGMPEGAEVEVLLYGEGPP